MTVRLLAKDSNEKLHGLKGRHSDVGGEEYAMYLAVLPFYRQACIKILSGRFGRRLLIFAGDHQLDKTVRTGVSPDLYHRVQNVSVANKILVQLGGWRRPILARTTILDLNPRSVSSWAILLCRRALRKKTLLWGHLSPRGGAGSRTAQLREFMRSLASGTVLYGYSSVPVALSLNPKIPVWVAPNSLYEAKDITPTILESSSVRFLYVGRLVASKKVRLLVEALAAADSMGRRFELDLVGTGDQEAELRRLASRFDLEDRVTFHGQVNEVERLREIYGRAFCSVSPGYAGLSVTQSLGFGVPIAVARDEPHAPEIELARLGGVHFFDSDNPKELARALNSLWDTQNSQGRSELSSAVRSAYSAEAMAEGLEIALTGGSQILDSEGWPAR